MDVQAWLAGNIARLVADSGVAGASVAVLHDGEIVTAAAGTANLRTGVEATTGTLFQIGSVTKIWTTTLVMRLVDEGLVDLDAPVTRYLPEFRTSAPADVTVRQLLNHTAGFEGDAFKDTGLNPDAVERFVAEILPEARQALAPGTLFSYNNGGFVVLGRIVEVLRGTTWARAVREEIADPLGLTVAIGAGEAILHRAAVGHIRVGGDLEVAAAWELPASNDPAGARLATTAADLAGFARLHLNEGLAPDGTRILSAESARLMRVATVDVPRRSARPVSIGLGWHLFDWAGGEVFGHDGNTVGQSAFLRLAPERGVAVAMLTNGGDASGLFKEVYGHIMRELGGVEIPPALELPAEPKPVERPERYVGAYESGLARFDVSDVNGRLWLDTTPGPDLAHLAPAPPRRELLPVGEDLFMAVNPDAVDEPGLPLVFVGDLGDGRAAFMHNHRANPRVG